MSRNLIEIVLTDLSVAISNTETCRDEMGTELPACNDELIHSALQALNDNEGRNRV